MEDNNIECMRVIVSNFEICFKFEQIKYICSYLNTIRKRKVHSTLTSMLFSVFHQLNIHWGIANVLKGIGFSS